MIKKISYIENDTTNPYYNLALEENLLLNVQKDECILYLWQNQNTVVIGRNQNCWKECKVKKLEEDGGHLVRRLSGGGAVFHDLGNLNFTFLVCEENYSVDRQLEVILRSVQKLGIEAEKSDRNDITVDGKKFSGNAFYETGGHCYHHGTLMVNVNIQDLSKYLNVSVEKLNSKGVDSVSSRVTNLSYHNENLSIPLLKKILIETFGEVYGLEPVKLEEGEINKENLQKSIEKLSSWEWIFGRKIEFQYEITKRFSWGDIALQLKVNGGKLQELGVYSDTMNQQLISKIPDTLKGCLFEKNSICTIIGKLPIKNEVEKEMITDIQQLIYQQEFL